MVYISRRPTKPSSSFTHSTLGRSRWPATEVQSTVQTATAQFVVRKAAILTSLILFKCFRAKRKTVAGGTQTASGSSELVLSQRSEQASQVQEVRGRAVFHHVTFVDDQHAVSFLHSAQTMSYDQNGSAHRAVVDRLLDLTKEVGGKRRKQCLILLCIYCSQNYRAQRS